MKDFRLWKHFEMQNETHDQEFNFSNTGSFDSDILHMQTRKNDGVPETEGKITIAGCL